MEETKYDVLIFDCYNVFYRWSYSQEEKIVSVDNIPTHIEGIIAFLKAVDTYIKKFGTDNTKCFFLFDNAKTVYDRKKLSPLYKSNRKSMPDWFYRELDLCELILHFYRENSYIFRVPNYEADDYVSNIIRSYIKDDEKVLMISEDMDWSRYLKESNPMVNQYRKHYIMDVNNFKDIEHFYPTESNIMFYKTFYGDNSDNIIGCLSNLEFTLFNKIIDNYKDIYNFIDDVKNKKVNFLDLSWYLKIIKEEDNLKNNWELIKTIEIDDVELSSYSIKCHFNPNKLQIIYSSLNILGLVDPRIKGFESKTSIFDMLEGESLARKQ